MSRQADALKLVPQSQPTLRAALYCRYSSDIQNDRSIERQVADLEKAAARLNFKLDSRLYCEDRAQTATSLFDRPGLTRKLLGLVEKGLVDVVLVEHTDRLSREPADAYWLKSQFKFNGVKVYTPSGEVSDIQWAFESYQNAADIEKIRFRVRSGHDDKARQGLIMHAPPYGYDDIPGKPGEKKPNDAQVEIVIRIFREYVSRKSPRSIASDLNRDGVLSPSGAQWTFQTINKMLQNELYVGVYVKNKLRRIKNPNTGNRITRTAPAEDLITAEVPHLRILDRDLWDAAQALRTERADKIFAGKQVERSTVARRMHPFAGLWRCGQCGSKMIICGSVHGSDRAMACSTAWWGKSGCSHRKSYSLARLTALATDQMHSHLTNPDFVKERAKERAKELARLERESSTEREVTQRELDRVELRIKKLIRLTEDDDGDDVSPEVVARLKELRVEQRGLAQRLVMIGASTNVTTLHPNAIKALARDVDTLHDMLKSNPDDPACRLAIGNLIEQAVVHPTEVKQPYEISLYARHAAYIGDLPLFPDYTAKKPSNFHCGPCTNKDNDGTTALPVLIPPVLIGRWREAA